MPEIRLGTLPPEEAIDFFRQKGYRVGFDYRDVWQQEHQAAFTVAKAMQVDLLAVIREQVDAAIELGITVQEFRDTLKPNLVRRGWWGRAEMADPITGETKAVQLGSNHRLKVIYDTNLRQAHSEGQWMRIQAAKDALPYLMYDHTPSEHERKEHKAWDGLVLRVDDQWWIFHFPKKAYGCHCNAIQLGQRQLDRLGVKVGTAPAEQYVSYTNKRTGEVQQIPVGVDPSFHYPMGGRLANLGKMLADKVEAAPAAIGAAVFKSDAPASMPQLMQGYTAWVNAIEGGGGKGLGGRRVIGAVSPATLEALERTGVTLTSAGLAIEQREVTHLFAEQRKAHKAIEREWVYALPERLAAPDAVLYDRRPGAEALLYVWKLDDGRYARIAVRPNYKLKGDARTNAIRSGHIVERDNLSGKYFEMLEGKL
jgi:hypothetical protein